MSEYNPPESFSFRIIGSFPFKEGDRVPQGTQIAHKEGSYTTPCDMRVAYLTHLGASGWQGRLEEIRD